MKNDLISRSALLRAVYAIEYDKSDLAYSKDVSGNKECRLTYPTWQSVYCAIKKTIEDAPTISPDSLREHGRWEWNPGNWDIFCSSCRSVAAQGDKRVLAEYKRTYRYCPFCGAKMDLEG